MKHIQHVFFDLDHTLWDFEKNSALTFERILSDYNVEVDHKAFIEVYKPINLKYWKLYRDEKVSKEKLRYSRLSETFTAINYQADDTLIHNLSIKYIEYLPDFNHLFDGTIELLDYLKGKYQLHIITNGFEEVQTKKMSNAGILHYFDQVITSESVGVKKPNPKVFTHALSKANASPKASMMIGDNLEADILGAKACDIDVIYCNFENDLTPVSELKTVTHLLEIKNYL